MAATQRVPSARPRPESQANAELANQNIRPMTQYEHQRHKPPIDLSHPRELVVALPPMRSQVNVSRVVRAAGCFGIRRVVVCGNVKIDHKIARNAEEFVDLERHRSLSPVLKNLRSLGYQIVGLEQTEHSTRLPLFHFARRTVLVVGHERIGLTEELLRLMNHVVEIPNYGQPFSHNAATAAAIAMYEYCRQYPLG
jgi:tRNA G18 (ribose-2'-O)-methylase SpoU